MIKMSDITTLSKKLEKAQALIEQLQEKNNSLQEEVELLKNQQEQINLLSTKTMVITDDPLYLEKIMALLPGHIYWFDNNGITLGCNEQQARTFGLASRYEFIGKSLYELFPKELADTLMENNRKVIESGKPYVFEEVGTALDGSKRFFLSQKLPLKNIHNQVVGVFGISFDITERKEMEQKLEIAMCEAQSSNRAKTEFLINMSHDIRTPFSGIIGIAEKLFEKEEDEVKKQELDMLLSASYQLLTLLNDILEFSKIESGAFQIKKEYVRLETIIPNLTNLFYFESSKKKVKFSYHIATNVPKMLIIDRMRLQRILLNLLSNAIKFTEQGEVIFEINWDEANNKLLLKISDTGIGIPASFQSKAFEKFTRAASNAHFKTYEGTGIGLYVVKRFVEDMNGLIAIASKENQGTIVTVSLPAEVGTDEVVSQADCKIYSLDKNASVLVVEDNPVAQIIAREILLEFNCLVEIASSLQEARACLNQNQYAFIFLDFGLPDGCGLELINDIQETQEKAVLIGVTANDSEMKDVQGISLICQKPLTRKKCKEIFRTV